MTCKRRPSWLDSSAGKNRDDASRATYIATRREAEAGRQHWSGIWPNTLTITTPDGCCCTRSIRNSWSNGKAPSVADAERFKDACPHLH
jgi:hypothetical protein